VKNIYVAVRKPGPVRGRKPTFPFILFVGNLKPHKNLTRLLQAFSLLKQEKTRKDLKLIIVGQKEFRGTEVGLDESSFTDVVFPGYIDDSELALYMKHASCLAMVSLYEGFGLPPLEALHFKTPVVASDIPVFREVLGKSAVFCNPRDPESIKDALVHVLGKKKQGSAVWEKNVKKNLERFSYSAFKKRLHVVLAEVLKADNV